MIQASRLREPGATIAAIAAVAIAYVAFAALGFALAYSTKEVTAVWAPAGIALAAILLGGYRLWPGVFVGAFVANALNHVPVPAAAMIAVGNTLGPVVGAYLMRNVGFEPALARVRDVLTLLVFGSLLAMTITATNGTLTLAIAKLAPWSGFGSTWALWWAGDAMGVLIVTPLILSWARPSNIPIEGGTVELLALMVAAPFVSWLAFASGPLPIPLALRHASWVYPIAVWAALRFRQRETTTVVAATSVIAIAVVSGGLNRYAVGASDQRLAGTMSFLAILAITSILISALTQERREARRQLDAALRKTTRVAQTLQEAMLPAKLPHHRRLSFDALYVTAEEDALVGGDWYDAFLLPSGNIAVSVGDVAGHGVDAAVAAERVRQAIFAAAADSEDPATILAKADKTLTLQQANAVATAIVAIVDPQRHEMRYATAGHPPPLIAAPSEPPQRLTPGGTPLGIARPIQPVGDEPKTRSVSLAPKSLIVFYTDGLVEFKRDAAAAEAQLLEHASALASDSAHPRPASALREALMGNAPPRDDTVLLTIRLLPEA